LGPGNLIAERLPTTGGHQHQRIAAARDVLDDRLLRAAEGCIAENTEEDLLLVCLHADSIISPSLQYNADGNCGTLGCVISRS